MSLTQERPQAFREYRVDPAEAVATTNRGSLSTDHHTHELVDSDDGARR